MKLLSFIGIILEKGKPRSRDNDGSEVLQGSEEELEANSSPRAPFPWPWLSFLESSKSGRAPHSGPPHLWGLWTHHGFPSKCSSQPGQRHLGPRHRKLLCFLWTEAPLGTTLSSGDTGRPSFVADSALGVCQGSVGLRLLPRWEANGLHMTLIHFFACSITGSLPLHLRPAPARL